MLQTLTPHPNPTGAGAGGRRPEGAGPAAPARPQRQGDPRALCHAPPGGPAGGVPRRVRRRARGHARAAGPPSGGAAAGAAGGHRGGDVRRGGQRAGGARARGRAPGLGAADAAAARLARAHAGFNPNPTSSRARQGWALPMQLPCGLRAPMQALCTNPPCRFAFDFGVVLSRRLYCSCSLGHTTLLN